MGTLTDRMLDDDGHLTVKRLASEIGEPEDQVLIILGLETASADEATQQRLREVVEILERPEAWAGSPNTAWQWYVTTPIPALCDTPAAIVRSGWADDVIAYIEHIAEGGYA